MLIMKPSRQLEIPEKVEKKRHSNVADVCNPSFELNQINFLSFVGKFQSEIQTLKLHFSKLRFPFAWFSEQAHNTDK